MYQVHLLQLRQQLRPSSRRVPPAVCCCAALQTVVLDDTASASLALCASRHELAQQALCSYVLAGYICCWPWESEGRVSDKVITLNAGLNKALARSSEPEMEKL